MTAFVLSFWLICRRINQKKNSFNVTIDNIYDFAVGALLVSLISARIYYVLFNLKEYKARPLEIFKVWNGGLAIYGAIIGLILYAIVFCKKKKINFYNLADLIVPYLALSQSIGRWGNFINQEAYGGITNLPWKMGVFDNVVGEYIYVHPTFFYESICTFTLFLILMKLSKNRGFEGQIFFSYMIGYGLVRSIVEGFRADSLMLGIFRISQVLSVIFVVLFGILYFYKKSCRTKVV
ncbi:MAG: prolipoprotein diacylglyceryl transferase [Clostridia bacterium]|nr:prolipoprotein diacylglyceryl transferase [Clostridia bacterium]